MKTFKASFVFTAAPFLNINDLRSKGVGKLLAEVVFGPVVDLPCMPTAGMYVDIYSVMFHEGIGANRELWGFMEEFDATNFKIQDVAIARDHIYVYLLPATIIKTYLIKDE